MCVTQYNIIVWFSYLRTLLGPFNEEANKFIEQLKPLADGVAKVPMKVCFVDYLLNVISKVSHSVVYM